MLSVCGGAWTIGGLFHLASLEARLLCYLPMCWRGSCWHRRNCPWVLSQHWQAHRFFYGSCAVQRIKDYGNDKQYKKRTAHRQHSQRQRKIDCLVWPDVTRVGARV